MRSVAGSLARCWAQLKGNVGIDAKVCTNNPETAGDCLQLLGRSPSLQPEQMVCHEMCLLGWEVFIWNHKVDQWAGFGPCSPSGYMSGCAVVPQMTIFFFFVVGRGGSSATWQTGDSEMMILFRVGGMGLHWSYIYMNDARRMISLQKTFWNVLENIDLHQNWGWE